MTDAKTDPGKPDAFPDASSDTSNNLNQVGSDFAIELRGISKRFGAVRANQDIDLAVRRGTIHGIVGENGAGKSTLMSILYGFYQADSGEVIINGNKVSINSSRDAISVGIGMVHQHFMLVDTFSVLENVMLGAEGYALIARCLLYTSPSPRDKRQSRMPSSA